MIKNIPVSQLVNDKPWNRQKDSTVLGIMVTYV